MERPFEQPKEKTASQINIEQHNPRVWGRLSRLSVEDQDQEWFRLTQKHLREFKAQETNTPEFAEDEDALVALNHLGLDLVAPLDPAMPQRGFLRSPEKRLQKLECFGDAVEHVVQEIEHHRKETNEPFYILVSGIGSSGKATMRKAFAKELEARMSQLRVVSFDRDYDKIFPPRVSADVYVVEDVHGLDEQREENGTYTRIDGSDGAPDGYQFVVYVLPSRGTYKRSLLSRGVGWIRRGKVDLTQVDPSSDEGQADRKKKIIHAAAQKLDHMAEVGSEWFKEQLRVLRYIKRKGVPIMMVDPTKVMGAFYGLKEDPALSTKDFETALTEIIGD
ncbi:MAG: hypothetical protein KBC26_02815 [Candidatus Pacebacteria bacterium]|nr:hypothetical protein [Candidatus Paceibacterota bacterium]